VVILFILFKFIYSSTFVKAEVDKSQVNMGSYFTFTVSISTELKQTAENLEIKELNEDFKILSQYQSSSYSSTFVNGKFQSSTTVHYSYVLSPKSEGIKTIPALEVLIDKKVYKTSPLEVKVLPNNSNHSTFSSEEEESDSNSDKNTKTNFYQFDLKLMVDKTNVYVGEQIIVSYFLISRVSLDNPDIYKRPEFKGFIKEDLETVSKLNFSPQLIDGQTYNVALLSKHALYPVKEGVFYVDSLGFRANVLSDEDVFGGGFFSFRRPRQATRESKTVKVNVKNLPDEKKPTSFINAVGEFQISSSLSSIDIRTGIPFSLFIKINGKGNIRTVEKLDLDIPDSLELFEIKQSYNINSLGIGEKIFEYVLIPRSEGEHEIKEYNFSFFNPNKNKYETLALNKIFVNSKGSLSLSSRGGITNTFNTNKDTIKQDIRYIKENINLLTVNYYINSIYYYYLYLIALLLFIVLVYKYCFVKAVLSIDLVKKQSNLYLKTAVESKNFENSIKYFVLALVNVISFKVNMSMNSESYDNILNEYYKNTNKKELLEEIKKIINFSNNLRYKGDVKNFNKNEYYKLVKKLIKEIVN